MVQAGRAEQADVDQEGKGAVRVRVHVVVGCEEDTFTHESVEPMTSNRTQEQEEAEREHDARMAARLREELDRSTPNRYTDHHASRGNAQVRTALRGTAPTGGQADGPEGGTGEALSKITPAP